jgi:lysophospholipase L1-like esterase
VPRWAGEPIRRGRANESVTRALPLLLVAALGAIAAGCGGRPASPIVVAALGDSITAGSPGYDPDPSQRAIWRFGDDPRSTWEHWAAAKDGRLRFRNCGVFGERTDQIAARLHTCAKGADVLVVQGGINDIAQGRSIDDAESNLRAMVQAGKRLGLRMAVADVLPWNNAYAAAKPRIEALNAAIHRLAHDEHVTLLPFHATLDDPGHPGSMPKAWTAEGNHPSVAGYRRLGELAFRLP